MENNKNKKKNIVSSPEEEIEIIEEIDEISSFKGADIKKIKAELKKCKEERQEYLDGWQRAKADFINARKDDEKSRQELVKRASEDILSQLLPVADSFEMAFANKEAWESVDANWRNGVEYIYSQMIKTFEDNGLVQVTPDKEKFDPTLHESVEIVEVEESDKDGMIVEVVQRGYILNGKIMRPARVKVGMYKK